MEKSLPFSENLLIRISVIMIMAIAGLLLAGTTGQAQIYEPEGLNMPGAWNGWTNPPVNNLALASYTQVPGGRVVKFSTGIQRWQTIFSVATTGGDIAGGTYAWLFTSGSVSNPWGNKWANTNATINTLQSYTFNSGADNTITVTDNKWYTMNFEDAGYVNTRAIFMETSGQPVDIASVSVPVNVDPGNSVVITVTTSLMPSAEELFYVRYSIDAWATSSIVTVSMAGTSGTTVIPGQPAGTVVSYYAFSSTVAAITADYDLYTIKLNSNGGTNYTYTVNTPVPVITFANLQDPPSGTIDIGDPFQVSGRALIPGITGQATPAPGLEAWVGYSVSNTDPAGWSDWITATFTGPVSGQDEFSANPGAAISTAGTYYYATRFRLNGGSYLYGGYSVGGGGFWDGTSNISGVLTVQIPAVPMFRTLENITIGAEENICYDAKQTITIAGNTTFFNVENGGAVTLIAGQNILFLPGTRVFPGGYLSGYITSTGAYCASLGAPPVKEAVIKETGPDQSGIFSFRIFPNPATSEVTLELKGVAREAESQFEIFGIRGNRISERVLTGSGNHSLSVGGIPAGVYGIRIISGGNVQTRMMVKE